MLKKLLLYIMALVLLSCSSAPKIFTRLDTGDTMELEEMLALIKNERVIFIGEIHADEESQALQFEVVKYLFEQGKDITVAVEIFPAGRQDVLDRWIDGAMEKDDFKKEFMEIVNLPFSPYEKIFKFAKKNGVRLMGIDADTEFINDAARRGPGTVSGRLLKKYKYSDCSEYPGYAELLGFDKGIGYHERGFPFLCDGQRLRDAVMAYNIARVLKENRSMVVVLAGVAHAAKVAVPTVLQKHIQVSYKVLMSRRIEYLIQGIPDEDVADYLY